MSSATPAPADHPGASPQAAAGAATPHPHPVDITVNGHPVHMPGPEASGLEIKEAAIAQGVAIKLDFVLMQETAPGKRRIIQDQQHVGYTEHSRFFAIPPDDNSDIDRADV